MKRLQQFHQFLVWSRSNVESLLALLLAAGMALLGILDRLSVEFVIKAIPLTLGVIAFVMLREPVAAGCNQGGRAPFHRQDRRHTPDTRRACRPVGGNGPDAQEHAAGARRSVGTSPPVIS